MILDSLILWAFIPSEGNPSLKWLIIHFIIRTIGYGVLLFACWKISNIALGSIVVRHIMSVFVGVIVCAWVWTSAKSVMNYKQKV